MKAKYAILDNR